MTRAEGAKGGSKESTPPRGRQSQPGGIDSELAEVRWHYQGENEGGGKGGQQRRTVYLALCWTDFVTTYTMFSSKERLQTSSIKPPLGMYKRTFSSCLKEMKYGKLYFLFSKLVHRAPRESSMRRKGEAKEQGEATAVGWVWEGEVEVCELTGDEEEEEAVGREEAEEDQGQEGRRTPGRREKGGRQEIMGSLIGLHQRLTSLHMA